VLDINTDMIGRNSPEFPESILVLVSEKDKTALLAMAKAAAAEIGCDKMDLRLEENDPWSHGVRSDQASFESKGIPWVLVTRGFMQPDYHRPSDDADTINYDKVAWSAKLIYELLRDAGNR
jgi:Zn-dependent M28 family amino/carboxypeptidase